MADGAGWAAEGGALGGVGVGEEVAPSVSPSAGTDTSPVSTGEEEDAPAPSGRVRFDEEIAYEIRLRLRAGESLMSICRDERMPHRTTVREWAYRRAEFGEQILIAVRQVRLNRRRADLARAMIPRDARGRWSTYTHEQGAEICRRLVGGESLIAICRDEAMPCYATVLNWARRVPEFGEAYADARRMAGDYLFDEAREIALGATAGTVWVDRLRFDIVRWQAARIAPRKYVESLVVAEAMDERAAERRARIDAEVRARSRARWRELKAERGWDEEDEARAMGEPVPERPAVRYQVDGMDVEFETEYAPSVTPETAKRLAEKTHSTNMNDDSYWT